MKITKEQAQEAFKLLRVLSKAESQADKLFNEINAVNGDSKERENSPSPRVVVLGKIVAHVVSEGIYE